MADGVDLPWWMYRDDGGPTYLERHGHRPDEPCGPACHGNPSPPGGTGGAVSARFREMLAESMDQYDELLRRLADG